MQPFLKKLPTLLLTRLVLVSLMLSLVSPLGLNWGWPVQTVKAASALIQVTVNTGPAGGPVNGDGCTLREAIDNANALGAQHPDCTTGTGSGDLISFQGAMSITFSNSGTGEMFIDKPMTIQGPVMLNGNAATRLFHIQGGAALTISGVSFTNGFSSGSGGAILLENGSLTGRDSSQLYQQQSRL